MKLEIEFPEEELAREIEKRAVGFMKSNCTDPATDRILREKIRSRVQDFVDQAIANLTPERVQKEVDTVFQKVIEARVRAHLAAQDRLQNKSSLF